MILRIPAVLVGVALINVMASVAAESPVGHGPDPLAVQRCEKGHRYPQAGWIVLHIEGEPYERGVQHGKLLATEIAAYVRAFSQQQSAKSPEEGWRITRTLVNALFLRKFDPEFLEEMKGIADGAAAAGAKCDGRPIDLVDIVAINCWAEITTLDGALEATPTGLEGRRFPGEQPKAMPEPPMGHCSAFAATGPATADGKIVFGHITMFGLYSANFFNVWLDVQPAKGRRVVMQTYPGGIQSGMDYYVNDAGLLVCETTIKQTRFNKDGLALASRIRKAVQYSENIDQIVENLTQRNNGLYSNEWLIGDTKTNEIAMLQLGTGKFKLSRSSKNEWYGGTEGFYWGCNNMKYLDLRLETIAGANDRPANMVWHASERDKTWQRLYRENKGKIDEQFGFKAFTTPPLAAIHSLDAKFTTTALAREMKSHVLFGPPLGLPWLPSEGEKKNYPEIRPLVTNSWTILGMAAPPPRSDSLGDYRVVDVAGSAAAKVTAAGASSDPVHTVPAWRGTILPKGDGDIWLAAGFAEYEKFVALEQALRKRSTDGKLSEADRERLAVEMNAFRVEFTESGTQRNSLPVTLSAVRRDDTDHGWYRRAMGKGVCVLHELRRALTPAVFDKAADEFGRQHAGREVSTEDFQKHLETASGRKLAAFFDYWVRGDQLPSVAFASAEVKKLEVKDFATKFQVTATVDYNGPGAGSATPGGPTEITYTVRGGDGKGANTASGRVAFDRQKGAFSTVVHAPPRESVLTLDGLATFAEGRRFTVRSFQNDWERTIIVYGTRDEEAANRDAARELQNSLRLSGPNITLPIKADREVTDADLGKNHLLLIGRPETNRFAETVGGTGAISWGRRSFTVRGDTYANAESAVVYAVPSPFAEQHVAIVIAGLSAETTWAAARRFTAVMGHAATAVVLPADGASPRQLVIPNDVPKMKHQFPQAN